MRLYPVVLCGGGGARLWPASRPDRPKPFVAFGGPHSLLRQTVDRVASLGPLRIVASVAHEALVAETLRQTASEARLILEPAPRDTAAAIAAASIDVISEDPEGVIIVAPADHYIPAGERFREAARTAAGRALRAEAICLMGLRPRAASPRGGATLRSCEETIRGAFPNRDPDVPRKGTRTPSSALRVGRDVRPVRTRHPTRHPRTIAKPPGGRRMAP